MWEFFQNFPTCTFRVLEAFALVFTANGNFNQLQVFCRQSLRLDLLFPMKQKLQCYDVAFMHTGCSKS